MSDIKDRLTVEGIRIIAAEVSAIEALVAGYWRETGRLPVRLEKHETQDGHYIECVGLGEEPGTLHHNYLSDQAKRFAETGLVASKARVSVRLKDSIVIVSLEAM